MLFENLIVPFLTGGVIVALVKYSAAVMKDTKLAAVIGGFPIGLFSIYFLSDKQALDYGWDYGVITSVLLFSIIVFNIMYKYFKLSKEVAHVISLLTWFGLALLRVYS